MPVTLLSGPINAGKSGRLLAMLAETDPGRTGTIVTPDRATAAALRRRFLAASKGKRTAIRSDAVQDWPGFLRRLASPRLPTASAQHTTLILLGLLGDLKLPSFGPTCRSYATATGFARAILGLKQNLIRPDELVALIETSGDPCLRERDLAVAYRAYEAELSRLGLLDEGDLSLLALKNALEGSAALSSLKLIAFDEFVMPQPLQVAMLRSLSQGLKDTAIFATCPVAASEEEKPFAAYLQQARAAWLAACDDEEALPAPKAAAPKVRVARCATPAQEARHVALMVADAGLDPQEIVVASRPGDSFLEWYLSEAHSLRLLPEHPTVDGAAGSPLFHELFSEETIEALPAEATLSRFVDRLRAIASLPTRVRPWIAGLKERRGHGRVAGRSLCAAEEIEAALQRFAAAAEFVGKTPLTRDQFVQLCSDDLTGGGAPATLLVALLPFEHHALGTPLAKSCERALCTRAIEGSLPRRAGEALFFGTWQEPSIRRIFADAEGWHAHEAFAFETLLAKCRGEVTLMIPATDDAGSETIASPFADRFLAGGIEAETLPACALPLTGAGRGADRLARIAAVEAARIAAEPPLESEFGAHLGVLACREVRALVRERFCREELSPSSLEHYANCPFSFFVRNLLHVDESAEETPQLRENDQGTLLHEILARFYRDHRDDALAFRGQKLPEERIASLLDRIAAEVMREMHQKLRYVSPALLERDGAETVRMALAAVVAEAEEARHVSQPLVPAAFEWAFGAEHGTALTLPVKGEEPLLIRGRVDRVDLDRDEQRFLVVDYKRSKSAQVVNQIESGGHLQLPLYVRAVREKLFPKAKPLGGLLLEIREIAAPSDGKKTVGKNKGLALEAFDGACYRLGKTDTRQSEERLEELLEAAAARATEFAAAIRRGIFPASNEANCRNCDYGDICRHKTVPAD